MILFSTPWLSAQNLSVPKYGITLGANYAKINFLQYNAPLLSSVEATKGYAKPKSEYMVGIKGGFFIDIRLTKKWFLSNLITYSQLGGDAEKNLTFNNDTLRTYGRENNTYRIDYAVLNPQFEYRMTEKFALCIGPSIGYIMNNNIEITRQEEEVEYYKFSGEINEINVIDFGIDFGMAANLTEKVDVTCKMYLGLEGIENQEDGYNISNKAMSLSIGYTF